MDGTILNVCLEWRAFTTIWSWERLTPNTKRRLTVTSWDSFNNSDTELIKVSKNTKNVGFSLFSEKFYEKMQNFKSIWGSWICFRWSRARRFQLFLGQNPQKGQISPQSSHWTRYVFINIRKEMAVSGFFCWAVIKRHLPVSWRLLCYEDNAISFFIAEMTKDRDLLNSPYNASWFF